MQEGFLWAIDCLGKAHTISTTERFWQQKSHDFQRRPLDFKRIAAGKHSAWGLSSDQFLHVYVYASDVPIRYLEYSFENQRWRPIHGFAERGLFFTDPPPFSDEKGLRKLPKPKEIKLPNEHWQWESDWRVETNVKGETAGGGWQYSVNFNHPDKYYPDKHWNSCVRRRKWIRYRKYIAVESWAKVPGVYPNHLDPPLIDLAAGGHELPGQAEGYMTVWVVTAHGKLFCRVGINHRHPEGVGWREVSLPPKVGVLQVSVSPTGIIWVVTHDGTGLVRTRVSRDYPLGLGWEVVEPPENRLLLQLTVGMNSIWGLTKDGMVWFRKGFDLMLSITEKEALTGYHWVEMPGKMAHLSIGPNDQVWAISFDERKLYMRTGITYEELSGRSWKLISVTEKRNFFKGSQDTLHFLDTPSLSSSDIFTPPSKISFFPFSPAYDSQMGSFASLPYPDKTSIDGYISLEEPFVKNGKNLRNFSCQTEDLDPEGSLSSYDARLMRHFTDSDFGNSDGVSQHSDGQAGLPGRKNPRNSVLDRSISHSCDLLSWDSENKESSQRRHSIGDVPKDEEMESESRKSHDSTDVVLDKVQSSEEIPIKSYATLQRDADWDSDYEEEAFNFVEDETSDLSDNDLDPPSCANKEVQTDADIILGLSGCSIEGSSPSLYSSQVFDTDDGEASNSNALPSLSSASQENLPDSAVFDHFERSTLKRPVSNSFSGGTGVASPDSDLPRDSRSFSDVGGGRELLCLSPGFQNSRVSYVNKHYIQVDSDLSLRSGTFYDDDDDDDNMLWVWVCGGSCWVKPTTLPKWFREGVLSQASFIHKLKEGSWRGELLQCLQERRELETEQYGHYLPAVDSTSWVKTGRMQWQSEGRRRHWLDCSVDLEKTLGPKAKQDSKFTIVCTMYGKEKKIKIPIAEITCVFETSNGDKPTFSIHTAKRTLERKPVKLRVRTEEELRDWLVALSLACTEVQNIPATPIPTAMWCTTCRGDVFYHQTNLQTDTSSAKSMYWQQIGGHLHIIESCPAGVVWGIGMDNAAWIYTGGYGGGIFKGIFSSTSGIFEQTDTKKMYLFENQRWSPISGFSHKHAMWMTDTGKTEESKDSVTPPSAQWQWTSEWQIDFSVSGSTDKEGWQYARDFRSGKGFHKEKRWNDYARRRRWTRSCQLVTTGPWKRAQGLDLMDISIQVDADVSWDGPIGVWALGTNGYVMTRVGVTRHNPVGESWCHIPTDQPFQSISVGGKLRVWAVGKDGSAFFRNGVTPENITGKSWFHVTAPMIAPLKQISAGATTVWAVDVRKNLWYRENVTPNFPEGTRWILVSPKVRKVSVGPQDQVWILADSIDDARGVICRRDGFTPSHPQGKMWDKGAGGGILHLSVRGCSTEKVDKKKEGKPSM